MDEALREFEQKMEQEKAILRVKTRQLCCEMPTKY